jgi:hypothetical protein
MATYSIPSISTSAREKIQIAVLGSSAPLEERVMVTAGLVSCLHEVPVTDQTTVQLVLSLFATALPEISQVLTSAQSTLIELVTVDTEKFLDLLDVGGIGNPDPTILPIANPGHDAALGYSDVAVVYSGVALVLFAIGKQARDSAPTASTVNRPKALIQKYTILEAEQGLLPGRDHGPSVRTLERIYNAFNVYSEARALVTKCLLALELANPHPPRHLDPLMIQLRLLRNAGMTHVDAIHKLLRGHPWTAREPKLEPYYRKFGSDLAEFEKLPANSRAYHRLLAPPSEFLFLTSELRPLIAVAGEFVAGVEADFKDYVYNKDKYSALIREVKSRQPMYNPVQDLTILAKQLGVEDIPDLPAQVSDQRTHAAPGI